VLWIIEQVRCVESAWGRLRSWPACACRIHASSGASTACRSSTTSQVSSKASCGPRVWRVVVPARDRVISLAGAGQLDLLPVLYTEVVVPRVVFEEVV